MNSHLADVAAEQAVLGALLVKPEKLSEVLRIIPDGSFFSQRSNKLIFDLIVDLFRSGCTPDQVTITSALKEKGKLEQVGGAVFLADLYNETVTAANVTSYAKIVAEKAEVRRIRDVALQVAAAAERGEDHTRLLTNIRRSTPSFSPINSQDLATMEFAEPRWAVPDLIPDGLTILAGKPKVGKSYFALNLAVAKAAGGIALGKIQIKEKGGVLFLALEDSYRRLKKRLLNVVQYDGYPENLHFLTSADCPPFAKGGLTALNHWIEGHPDITLVIIDTLARIKPAKSSNRDSYDHDALVIATLQAIALKHEIALILIHHTRKATGEDFLDTVPGTFGLTGAADAVAVLARKTRLKADATLQVTGRDVADIEIALKFHRDLGIWELLGEAQEFAISKERADVLLILRETGKKTSVQLAKILGKSKVTTRSLLKRMKDCGEILVDSEGNYYL